MQAATARRDGTDACQSRTWDDPPGGLPESAEHREQPRGAVSATAGVLSPSPNQVVRLDKITQSPLNHAYRTKLANMGSVFQHYLLVNTQWPLNGRRRPPLLKTTINMRACWDGEKSTDCYAVKPDGLRLRNTALETYQVSFHEAKVEPGTGQASSAGCIQCHGISGVDFSFVWTDAVTAPVPLK